MNLLKDILLKNKKMLIVGILCLILPPILNLPGYQMYMINIIGIYVIVAVGLNLLLGYTGQISIGHAAFIAIGAFTVALLEKKVDVVLGINLGVVIDKLGFLITIPIAGLVACIIGMILGLPALRLHGHYLAIATLGFGVAVTQILTNWDVIGFGMSSPAFSILGKEVSMVSGDLTKYYVVLLFVGLAFFIANNVVKSRTGRAFMAIRDSEVAATAMGVNIAKYKVIVFGLSAFLAGVAGGLYTYVVPYLSPHDFHLGMSLNIFAMIVIGGMGNLRGAIYGAVFMQMVPELFSRVQNLPSILMGASIILVTLFLPGGIVTLEQKLLSLFHKLKGKTLQMSKRGGS